MRHYTLTLFLTLSIALSISGCLSANAKEYKLYTDCDEYYDSRGFYHKKCDKNSFSKKEALRALSYINESVEPGEGETNTTAPLNLPPKKTDNSPKENLPEFDNIDDDELPEGEEGEEKKKKIRPIKDDVELEFGKNN